MSAICLVLCSYSGVFAQQSDSTTEFAAISETIMDYIDGTAYGWPDSVKSAFHPDFNLYYVNAQDSLVVRDGEAYINNIKPNEKSNRIGRIIAIDYVENAAMAKAEIEVPGWRTFTDYFLLMKYEGTWKIVQKSYTWVEAPKD